MKGWEQWEEQHNAYVGCCDDCLGFLMKKLLTKACNIWLQKEIIDKPGDKCCWSSGEPALPGWKSFLYIIPLGLGVDLFQE